MKTERSTPESGDELLAGFLASRDAACPTCGYNLRSVVSAACPECGAQLQLGVQETAGTLGRRWGLLLLLFCWLLLAGAMNDYRAIRTIHSTVTARQSLAWISSFNLQTQPGLPQTFTMPNFQVNRSFTMPVPPAQPVESDVADELLTAEAGEESEAAEVDLDDEVAVTIDSTDRLITLPPLANVDRQLTFRAPNVTIRTPQPPFLTGAQPQGGMNWSSVSWSLWVGAAWWTTMALAAAAGLAMLLWYRRRPVPRLAARTLTLIAWGAFCGYFGYHLVSFVRELA